MNMNQKCYVVSGDKGTPAKLSGNIEISRDDVEWIMQGLDFIREVAINHANPQDPTMEEWEPVFDAADDINRMLDDKMEADK